MRQPESLSGDIYAPHPLAWGTKANFLASPAVLTALTPFPAFELICWRENPPAYWRSQFFIEDMFRNLGSERGRFTQDTEPLCGVDSLLHAVGVDGCRIRNCDGPSLLFTDPTLSHLRVFPANMNKTNKSTVMEIKWANSLDPVSSTPLDLADRKDRRKFLGIIYNHSDRAFQYYQTQQLECRIVSIVTAQSKHLQEITKSQEFYENHQKDFDKTVAEALPEGIKLLQEQDARKQRRETTEVEQQCAEARETTTIPVPKEHVESQDGRKYHDSSVGKNVNGGAIDKTEDKENWTPTLAFRGESSKKQLICS